MRFLAFVFSLFYLSNLNSQNFNKLPVLDTTLRPFYHGVASGDPEPDKVMIWTRVTPDNGTISETDVHWQIATDIQFQNIVNWGRITARESNDWCVKIDVCNLQPNTFYYYVFENNGRKSIIARTKTAPASTADNDSARFAVVSCASYEHGYFNAYQSIVNKNDVDAVIHLGDYIYEYATGDFSANINGRTYDPPAEAINQAGYQLRHSQYKLDPKLRRIHQMFPFITVWDDHETCNDAWSYGGENHNPGEGSYIDRKAASTSTYFKWMPIRKPDPLDTIRIFRKLRYGKLLDLVMLDTRLYDRDEQDAGSTNDPNHTIMGPIERNWFLQQLSDTSTRWKIIGNQVMFAPLEIFGIPANSDQWDGYNYERQIIHNHIINNNIKDIVILTGDIHTSWCNDIPGPNYNSNNGSGSLAVEFVGPSVTSFNLPLPVGENILKLFNPHMKYINVQDKGYYTISVNKNRTQADYVFVDELNANNVVENAGPRYLTQHLSSKLTEVNSPAPTSPFTSAIPPLNPIQSLNVVKFTHLIELDINENQSLQQTIIPDADICPAFNFSVLDSAVNGTAIFVNTTDVLYTPISNFYGSDTIKYVFCSQDGFYCDTVTLIIHVVPDNDVEVNQIFTDKDSTVLDCFSFNDLTTTASIVNYYGLEFGTVLITDSCLQVSFETSYCGKDTLFVTACDSVGFCDTVMYIFRVNHATSLASENLGTNENTSLSHCFLFDDLLGCVTPTGINRPPQHGFIPSFTDSCFTYNPVAGFFGFDTLTVVRCDTCPAPNCDTILFSIEVKKTVAVPDVTMDMVVLGIFPIPANDYLNIQLYTAKEGNLQVQLFDITGRRVLNKILNNKQSDLYNYHIDVSAFAPGNYQLLIKFNNTQYTKKIIVN